MRINCRCEHCSKKLRATEEMLGKKAKCPECGAVTVLRAAEVPATVEEWEPSPAQAESPRASAKPKASAIREEPPYDEAAFDEVEDYVEQPPVRTGTKAKPFSQTILVMFVVFLGFAGAVFSGLLAYKWQTDMAVLNDPVKMKQARERAQTDPILAAKVARLDKLVIATYCLYAAAGLGLLGALLAIFHLGTVAGACLLIGPIAPAVLLPETLAFTGGLALGGILAFFIRSRRTAQMAAEMREAKGLPPARRSTLSIVGAILAALVVLGYYALIGGAMANRLMQK